MGSCEHGNVPLGSIKCGEFLDQLSGYQFLRKDSAASILIVCIFNMESGTK
jgi:hypothetical protein